jgi:hypothetical protein
MSFVTNKQASGTHINPVLGGCGKGGVADLAGV